MKFVDLPQIEMTATEIFAANQKANTPIPIRRADKTGAGADDAARASNLKTTTPNASAFAGPVAASVAPATSSVKAANAANASNATGEKWRMSDNLSAAASVPRRKWEPLWIPLALATWLLVGLLGGWIFALISESNDTSFLISLAIIGFGVGLACYPAIRLGKCRSIVGAGALATLTCALVYFAMLGWSGVRMRDQAIAQFAPVYAKTKNISIAAAQQKLAQQITPARAVAAYLGEMHQYGVVLSSGDGNRIAGSTGRGTHLSGLGFWAYFLFQIGLTSLVAGGLAISAAKTPFHEGTGTWYRKFAAYALHPAHVATLLAFCNQGRWQEAGKLAKASKTGGNIGANATVYHLPGQGGFVRVTASRVSKTLFEATLTEEEVRLWKPV